MPAYPSATEMPSRILALRRGTSEDTIDNSPEALWYYCRLGANILRLFLQAENQRVPNSDVPIYTVDTQTRRLLALLTGTVNVRLKDDPRDDESSSHPSLFKQDKVNWQDRSNRLVMFGRLVDSLSPVNFPRSRTPLTDPISFIDNLNFNFYFHFTFSTISP